jgi:hypothetical protein
MTGRMQLAAILGKSLGLFKLDNSDLNPGSFFTVSDLEEIFGVPKSSFSSLPVQTIEDRKAIDEKDIQAAWYRGAIPKAPETKIRNFSRSFDELVLATLIRRVYPEAKIEEQVKWGRKSLDFIVHHPKFGTKIIEFQGPGHFAPGRYAKEIPHPRIRKEMAESQLEIEYIDWPYWIQRCSSNVRAIFEPDVKGFGLLWSANVHFSEFVFDDSASIILDMSSRFNALRGGGLSYIYGPNTAGRVNVEHPIISSITKGKTSPSKLLPKGYADTSTWLPKRVLEMLPN